MKCKYRRMIMTLLSIVFVGYADQIYTCQFSQSDLQFSEENGYDIVRMKDCLDAAGPVGAPMLSVKSLNFLIPKDKTVSEIEIISSTKSQLPGTYDLYPIQPSRTMEDTQTLFVGQDSRYYASKFNYPPEIIIKSIEGYRSGFKIVNVNLQPVVYNPTDKKLYLYTEVQFALRTVPCADSSTPCYRRSAPAQKAVEDVVKGVVENPEDVFSYAGKPEIMDSKSKKIQEIFFTEFPGLKGLCADVVIVTSDALKNEFQTLADWKTKRGAPTVIRTVEWINQYYRGCDLQEKIRNFVKEAYSYWGTVYVVLGGDVNVLPCRYTAQRITSSIASDFYFSDLEGNWNGDGDSLFGELTEPGAVYDLSILCEQNRYAIGPLLKWDDQKKSWLPHGPSPGFTFGSFDFINADLGWATIQQGGNPPENLRKGKIYRSTNRGNIWDMVYTHDVEESWLNSIDFLDFLNNSYGWACGYEKPLNASAGALIVRTTDGGNNWLEPTKIVGVSQLLSIYFIDQYRGWTCGEKNPSLGTGEVFFTTDGGISWHGRIVPNRSYFSLFFVGYLTGWMVGEDASIYHSTDGGDSWFAQTSPIPDICLYSVKFVNATEGWIAGENGYILHTTNGGAEWTILAKPLTTPIFSLDLISNQRLWVGSDDRILSTTNSGVNWTHEPIFTRPDMIDGVPDVFCGRIPAKTISDVATYIQKELQYEQANDRTYQKKFLIMGAAVCNPTWYERMQLKPWFEQNDLQKWELYAPKDYENGPELTWHGDEELTRMSAINSLNAGYNFVLHGDHCNPYAIGTGVNHGGGSLQRQDILDLTNSSRYSVLLSAGCRPNKFDVDCITKHGIINPNGFIAMVGNFDAGLGDEPSISQGIEFFHAFFDTAFHVGQALAYSQDLANCCNIVDIFNEGLLGDPEIPVWTNLPKDLYVYYLPQIPLEPTNYEVEVKEEDVGGQVPVKDALVTVWKFGEFYASGYTNDQGKIVFAQLTPETQGGFSVTAVKHNYIPHCGNALVFGSEMAHLSFDHYELNDDAEPPSQGNGNGVIDAGERIELTVWLKNTGTSNAIAPFSFASAQHLAFINNSNPAPYPDIPPGESRSSLLPYIFDVLSACPDTTDSVHLDIASPVKQGHWADTIALPIHAPTLKHVAHLFWDAPPNGDGDGIPDPGEHIDMPLTVRNNGLGQADDVWGYLSVAHGTPGLLADPTPVYFGTVQPFSEVTCEPPVFKFDCTQFYMRGLDSLIVTFLDGRGRSWSHTFELESLPRPSQLRCLAYQTKANLFWKSVDSAAGYNVYALEPMRKMNSSLITNVAYYQLKDLEPYTTNLYCITSVDSSCNESYPSDYITVRTSPPYQAGWPETTVVCSQGRHAAVAIQDLNPMSAGGPEVICASGKYVYAWHGDGTLAWRYDAGFDLTKAPAVADLNYDGTYEVIVAGRTLHDGVPKPCIHTITWDGQRYRDPALFIMGGEALSCPVISNLDMLGTQEIIVTAADNKLHGWSESGGSLPNWPISFPGWPSCVPAVANLDACETDLEIVCQYAYSVGNATNTKLVVRKLDGITELWSHDFNGVSPCAVSIGDIDIPPTPGLEVISLCERSGNPAHLAVFSAPGILRWSYGFDEYHTAKDVIIGNIDQSNVGLEVVANFGRAMGDECYDDYTYVFASNGALLHRYKLPNKFYAATNPLCGDINNDYSQDIIAGNNNLYALNHITRDTMEHFPMRVDDYGTLLAPAFGDLDNDGDIEIVAAYNDRVVRAWDLNGLYDPFLIDWGTYRHDNSRTGYLGNAFFSGELSRSTVWSGTVLVDGDVVVNDSVTLTIVPHTNVYFKPNKDKMHGGLDPTRAELIVKGRLVANLAKFSPYSRTPKPLDWYGIRFDSLSKGVIQKCKVEFAVDGVSFKNSLGVIVKSDIRRCRTGLKFLAGANKGSDGNQQSDTDAERGDTIICLSIGDDLAQRYALSALPNEKVDFLLIEKNAISQNDTGVICLNSNVMFRGNNVLTNDIGVYIGNGAQPELGSGEGGNVFSKNNRFALYNDTKNRIMAKRNDWGAANRDSIALMIWDYYDNKQLGIVDFEPFGGKSLAGGQGCQEAEALTLDKCRVIIPSPVKQKGRVELHCHLPKAVRLTVEIFNVNGQRLERISTQGKEGFNLIASRKTFASGIYFVSFTTDTLRLKRKVVVVK